ncbi:hypothetical protein AKAW_05908 [Aspergillus luchuensis IFO 4308]|nr:hypothetical protein AKAW_05908 [Aspergillus luchuensis IFO 4308]
MTMERTRMIAVSVDCGTTHTSVAWIHPDSTNVRFIDTWPGTQTPSTRVPTRIAYSSKKRVLQNEAWGYMITEDHVTSSWVKLLLEPEVTEKIIADDNKQWKDSVGIFHRPGGRDPTSIIRDFLGRLRKYSETHIKRKCNDDDLGVLPFAYILTVPATWSEVAISSMKKAARAAGFRGIAGDDPLVLSEPEAALTTMLCDPLIPAGDGVVVCDCGGGTLDIGTYFIHPKEIGDYRTVSNYTDPSGGSTMIDREFYAVASEKLKLKKLRRSVFSPTGRLMSDFESAKRDFEGTIGQEIGDIQYPTSTGSHSNSVDMLALQYPLIVTICDVLTAQINRAHDLIGRPVIKHVYVSGAAAHSVYLYNAIQRLFANSQITVYRHQTPEIAVAEGAARWARRNLLSVEQLDRHYGVESSGPPVGAMDLDNQEPRAPQGSPVSWVFKVGDQCSIGELRTATFTCRVFQDFPFAVINIYDAVPRPMAGQNNAIYGSKDFHFLIFVPRMK